MSDRAGYDGTHLLVAFLVGAVAGAVVGLLTAPSSGREARDAVRAWTRELSERAARAIREGVKS